MNKCGHYGDEYVVPYHEVMMRSQVYPLEHLRVFSTEIPRKVTITAFVFEKVICVYVSKCRYVSCSSIHVRQLGVFCAERQRCFTTFAYFLFERLVRVVPVPVHLRYISANLLYGSFAIILYYD